MSPGLVGGNDIEITRAQNRNFALADGFHRLARKDNTFPPFLRYTAQTERLYRRTSKNSSVSKSYGPNYRTKGDGRSWPPPEMKMGGVQSMAGLERAAEVGNGAQFVPKTKLAR